MGAKGLTLPKAPKEVPESNQSLFAWPPSQCMGMMAQFPRVQKHFGYEMSKDNFIKLLNVNSAKADEIWKAWGGDAEGLCTVNLLEIFSAIILASSCKMREKIQALFKFFKIRAGPGMGLSDFKILFKNAITGFHRFISIECEKGEMILYYHCADDMELLQWGAAVFSEVAQPNSMKELSISRGRFEKVIKDDKGLFELFTAYGTTDGKILRKKRSRAEAKTSTAIDIDTIKSVGGMGSTSVWCGLKPRSHRWNMPNRDRDKKQNVFPKTNDINQWPSGMLNEDDAFKEEDAKKFEVKRERSSVIMKRKRCLKLVRNLGLNMIDIKILPGTRFKETVQLLYPNLTRRVDGMIVKAVMAISKKKRSVRVNRVHECNKLVQCMNNHYNLSIDKAKIVRMQDLFIEADRDFDCIVQFHAFLDLLERDNLIDPIYTDFLSKRTELLHRKVSFPEVLEIVFGKTHMYNMQLFKSYIRRIRPLTAKEWEKARGLFDMYDRDSSGEIDREEMQAVYKDLKDHSKKAIDEIFDKIDLDGSGEIDIDEFVNFFRLLLDRKDSARGREERKQRRLLFEQMDIDQLEDLAYSARLIDGETKLKHLQREQLINLLTENVNIPIPVVKRKRPSFKEGDVHDDDDSDKLVFDELEEFMLGQLV
eukprot:jgi/Bigna1/83866/fgenesh1_pg.117_\